MRRMRVLLVLFCVTFAGVKVASGRAYDSGKVASGRESVYRQVIDELLDRGPPKIFLNPKHEMKKGKTLSAKKRGPPKGFPMTRRDSMSDAQISNSLKRGPPKGFPMTRRDSMSDAQISNSLKRGPPKGFIKRCSHKDFSCKENVLSKRYPISSNYDLTKDVFHDENNGAHSEDASSNHSNKGSDNHNMKDIAAILSDKSQKSSPIRFMNDLKGPPKSFPLVRDLQDLYVHELRENSNDIKGFGARKTRAPKQEVVTPETPIQQFSSDRERLLYYSGLLQRLQNAASGDRLRAISNLRRYFSSRGNVDDINKSRKIDVEDGSKIEKGGVCIHCRYPHTKSYS